MKRARVNSLFLAAGAMALVGITVSIVLAMYHQSILHAAGCELDSTLALTNNDGYFHLTRARTFAAAGMPLAGWFQDSLLLSRVLAILGGTDTASLLSSGAYVGPVLGLTMLLAVLPWAWGTRSPAVILLAPLLALFSPYWLDRTHVGVLDTDTLAPFLVYASAYCVMRFTTATSRRLSWVTGFIALLALQWLW